MVTCAKDNVNVMMMVMTVRSLMWKWRHLLRGEPLINTDAQFVFRILGNPRVMRCSIHYTCPNNAEVRDPAVLVAAAMLWEMKQKKREKKLQNWRKR